MGVLRRSKKAGIITMLVLAIAVPGALIGLAHTFEAVSAVTIRYNTDQNQFQGKVLSDRQACVRNRTVNVFKALVGADRLIGTATTGEFGFWSLPKADPHGNYYARVLRRHFGGYGHSHLCLGDRSRVIFVQ